jgi:hypothetical protein
LDVVLKVLIAEALKFLLEAPLFFDKGSIAIGDPRYTTSLFEYNIVTKAGTLKGEKILESIEKALSFRDRLFIVFDSF